MHLAFLRARPVRRRPLHRTSLPLAGGLLAALAFSPGCRVHSHSGPPRIVGTGIVRGHAALGIREQDELLNLHVSLNPNRLLEFSIWKLVRLEVGVVGASVGVGPFDLGLGALLYDPYVPSMIDFGEDGEAQHDDGGDDHEGAETDGGGDSEAADREAEQSEEAPAAAVQDRWR